MSEFTLVDRRMEQILSASIGGENGADRSYPEFGQVGNTDSAFVPGQRSREAAGWPQSSSPLWSSDGAVRPLPLPGFEGDVGAPATWPEAIVIDQHVPVRR